MKKARFVWDIGYTVTSAVDSHTFNDTTTVLAGEDIESALEVGRRVSGAHAKSEGRGYTAVITMANRGSRIAA